MHYGLPKKESFRDIQGRSSIAGLAHFFASISWDTMEILGKLASSSVQDDRNVQVETASRSVMFASFVLSFAGLIILWRFGSDPI